MSAFEDDVEPAEDVQSRGGTPFGASAGRGKQRERQGGVLGKHGREWSPEPDEELDTTDGKQTMWLVKVPRFLLQGWTKVDEEDRRLGTVRVYDNAFDNRGNPKMELLLPEHPEPAIPLPPSHPYLQTNYPRKYEMRLTGEQGASAKVKNLYAFRERMEGGDEDDDDDEDEDMSGEESSKGKERADDEEKSRGRRVVSMVGEIAQEAALKPQMSTSISSSGSSLSTPGITPEYREVLRKRRLEAAQPKHSVKILDESDISRRNMLTSGVGGGFSKSANRAALIPSKVNANAKKNQTEKFARMPRNELLDMLFELFEEYPYWAIKGLRNKVQQPEVYLREVLMTIADYHRVGPYASLWSLKPEYAAMRKQNEMESKAVTQAEASASGSGSNIINDADEQGPDSNSTQQDDGETS